MSSLGSFDPPNIAVRTDLELPSPCTFLGGSISVDDVSSISSLLRWWSLLCSVQIITTYLVGQDDKMPGCNAPSIQTYFSCCISTFTFTLSFGQVASLLFMFLALPFFILCRSLQKRNNKNCRSSGDSTKSWTYLKALHTPTFIFHHTDQPMCSLHRNDSETS